jgi:hypothetical protein
MNESPTATIHTLPTTEGQSAATDVAWVLPWLRAEGLAAFAAGLAGFLFLGLPWWAFVLLLMVPDVSMVGYRRGPRVGAIFYNVGHDLVTGVAIAGAGLAIGLVPVTAAGAVLVAHSGLDRMVGFGLKFPSSFKDTHLGRIERSH